MFATNQYLNVMIKNNTINEERELKRNIEERDRKIRKLKEVIKHLESAIQLFN